MKKMRVALLMMASVLVFSGCTKTYKTVDEYETAMKTVAAKIPAYTVEVKQVANNGNLYFKTYIKGDKWKTEMSMNEGSSYAAGMLYDGVDLLSYSQGSPYAVKNPMLEIVKKEADSETLKAIINTQNPTGGLFYWRDGIALAALDEPIGDSKNAEFTNQKAKMNGFDCRMIKFGDTREACVSDKYGIAVYHKLTTPNPQKPGVTDELTLNLVKIDTNDIPDSTFELPSGVKKADLDTMLNNMSKMMQSYK